MTIGYANEVRIQLYIYLHRAKMNSLWKIASEVGGADVQLVGVAGATNCPDGKSSWQIRTGSGNDFSFVNVVFTIIN